MHKIKSNGSKVMFLVVSLLFTVSVPVIAEANASYSGGGSSTVNSSDETSVHSKNVEQHRSTTVKVSMENSTDTSTAGDTKGHADRSELHRKGDALVNDLRKDHKSAKTAAERQKRCAAHKQGLTKKFSRIVTNSQKIQTRIDGIFAKALAYQQEKNLNPENFDSLVGAANDAKATSQASIDALKAVTPTLNCNSDSVASDVATFKAAAQATRTDLKSYRTAVKAVLKALYTAKNTTEGSNQ